MTSDSIQLTIDGQSVRVPAGTTIYDAARGLGIEIPVLCHAPQMAPVGVCRVCTVDVAGARATAFLSEVPGSSERTFASMGYGTDCRYQKPGLAGAALVHDDKLVHMAFFRVVAAEQPGGTLRPVRRR